MEHCQDFWIFFSMKGEKNMSLELNLHFLVSQDFNINSMFPHGLFKTGHLKKICCKFFTRKITHWIKSQ